MCHQLIVSRDGFESVPHYEVEDEDLKNQDEDHHGKLGEEMKCLHHNKSGRSVKRWRARDGGPRQLKMSPLYSVHFELKGGVGGSRLLTDRGQAERPAFVTMGRLLSVALSTHPAPSVRRDD